MLRIPFRRPLWMDSKPARALHRTALAAPLALAALYMVAVTGYNLPPSPLKVRTQGFLNAVVDPYLTQRWRLFAPDPPDGNYDGWLQVEYRTPAGTQTTPVLAFTQPLIDEAKAHWFYPPRVDRAAINLGYALSDVTSSEVKLNRLITARTQGARLTDADSPAQPISLLEADVLPAGWQRLEGADHMTDDQYFAAARDSLAGARKSLSGQAGRLAALLIPNMHLGGEPVRVRVFYTWSPIVPFSERGKSHPQQDPPIRIADTGWMPYHPVAR